MKIIKVQGGLGNQLFQYAFGEMLKNVYHISEIKYDISFLNQNDSLKKGFNSCRLPELGFDIDIAGQSEIGQVLILPNGFKARSRLYKITVKLESSLNKKYYIEQNRAWRDIESLLQYDYYDGYWQSWAYVAESKIHLPQYRDYESIWIRNLCSQNRIDKSSAFIGIRRGDYLDNSYNLKHFGTFDEAYFNRCIDYLRKHRNISNYHIFSNDIEWVKKNINFNVNNIIYHDKNHSDIEEFIMMSNCGHAIIVNSTFYWWAAYFISNKEKIVIAPEKWFADGSPIDIVLPTWVKMN